jgi:CDP-diacylglycerol---serine O-phosphatidyltransferase
MTIHRHQQDENHPEKHWDEKISTFLKKSIKSANDKRKKRFRRKPRKDINLLHILPNVLTSFNVACGAASIVYSVEGEYAIAAFLILVAVFFDLIDGKVARFVGSSSQFGVELDSLADVISFGAAPAILIYAMGYQGYHRLGLSLVLVYTLCTVLRLARYNVSANENPNKKREYFTGLPCPVPAVFLASLVWLLHEYQIPLTDPIVRAVLHITVVCLACLMVSTLPYPDIAVFKVEKKNVFQHNVTLVLILCVLVMMAKFFFLVGSTLFILSGPTLALIEMRRRYKAKGMEKEGKHTSVSQQDNTKADTTS